MVLQYLVFACLKMGRDKFRLKNRKIVQNISPKSGLKKSVVRSTLDKRKLGWEPDVALGNGRPVSQYSGLLCMLAN